MKVHKGFYIVLVFFFALFFSATEGHSQTTCTTPVMLLEDGTTHLTIMNAYDSANVSGFTDITLKLAAGSLEEDLFFDADLSVVLEGGYDDCSFSTNSSITGIVGSITISAGTLIPSYIGVLSPFTCEFDADGDGFTSIGSCAGSADDCNDNNPDVFPGAAEICDGLDNNCDGQIDEGLSAVDADGDSYSAIGSCGGSADDCNDNDPTIHPNAVDIPYDGIDQDCSGTDLTFAGETCVDCHAPASNWNNLHDLTTPPDGTCVTCHAAPVYNILSGHYGRTVRTPGNNITAGQTIVCVSCHDPDAANHTGGIALGTGTNFVGSKISSAYPNITCDTCHENRAALHATDTAHNNRIIDSACAQCHTINNQADIDTLHLADCASCHDYNGIKLDPGTVRQAIQDGLYGTQITCTACHTDVTPGDNHGVPTSGKHPAHLALPGVSCATCHETGNIPYFNSGTDDNPADGQISLAETDVCDSCHQDGAGNPTTGIKTGWTLPYFEVDCSSCHAVAPSTGSHDTHLVYTDCASCHDSAVSGTTAPAEHLDNNIDVYDASPGDLGYPADRAIGSAYTTCSNFYCHSYGRSDTSPYPAKFNPLWGDQLPGNCMGCHDNGDHNDENIATGSHNTHVVYQSALGEPRYAQFDCVKCHAETVADKWTVNDTSKHVNREVNIAFESAGVLPGGGIATYTGVDVPFAKTPGTGYGTCANTYCHSKGYSTTPPYPAPNVTPTWDVAFNDPWDSGKSCDSCHGSSGSWNNVIDTNAHLAHIKNTTMFADGTTYYGSGCGHCHSLTGTNSGFNGDIGGYEAGIAHHLNQVVNLRFRQIGRWADIHQPTDGGTFAGQDMYADSGAQVQPGFIGGACNNVYCHSIGNLNQNIDADVNNRGEGSVVTAGGDDFRTVYWNNTAWNDTTPITSCDQCHGDQAGNAHPIYPSGPAGSTTANSHVRHVEGNNNDCTYCHDTTDDTNIPPQYIAIPYAQQNKHINRLEDVTIKTINGQTGTFDDTVGSKTCSSTYCHNISTPQWGGTVACGDCHAVDNRLAGSHGVHYETATDATAADWTAARSSTVTEYIFNCGTCHDNAAGDRTHGGGPAGEVMQVADMYFDDTVARAASGGGYAEGGAGANDPQGFSYSYGTCNATYCHSRGTTLDQASYTRASVIDPQWDTTYVNRCEYCHDGDFPVEFTMATGSHTKHITYDRPYDAMDYAQFDCVRCHDATVSDSRTIDDKSKHVNQEVNVAFHSDSDPQGTGQYVDRPTNTIDISIKEPGSSFGDCLNTYCHSPGTKLTNYDPPNVKPTWGIPFTDSNPDNSEDQACASCHGSWYDWDYTMNTNAHGSHVNNSDILPPGSTAVWAMGCSNCHDATGQNHRLHPDPVAIANHINRKVDIKFRSYLDIYGPTFDGVSTTGEYGAEFPVEPVTPRKCNNIPCHSIGNLADNSGSGAIIAADVDNNGGTPDADFWEIPWDDTTTLGCNGCHGDLTDANKVHPVYPSGAAGSTTANSHRAHVEGENAGGGKNCTYCHDSTEDTNIPPTVLSEINRGYHSNQREEVSLIIYGGNPFVDFAYSGPGTKQCSNIYCHSDGSAISAGFLSNGQTVTWGGANMTCNSCHNTTDATNNLGPDYQNGTPKANSHAEHVGSYGCQACHYATTMNGSTITDGSLHANGTYNVTPSGGAVSFNYTYSAAGGTCSSNSCHGDASWGSQIFADDDSYMVRAGVTTQLLVLNNDLGPNIEVISTDDTNLNANCSTAVAGNGVRVDITCGPTTGAMGTFDYVIQSGLNSDTGTVTITTYFDTPPTLVFSQPDGVSDSVVLGDTYSSITYTLTDPDGLPPFATVDFYYDTDADMTGGTPITSCQNLAEGVNATCAWDTSLDFGLSPDTYYVYGIADDTINSTVSAVSSGTITLTPFQTPVVRVTNPTTGRVWMDRNLGASQAATSPTDAAAYGDLYQWGRGPDGHQLRTSETTTVKSPTDDPGHGQFIRSTSYPRYDWRVTQNDALWQGVSGTNNPCPAGFRLPTDAEWTAERLSWVSNDAAGAFASPLKLVLVGSRSRGNGQLNSVGSYGYYWGSSVYTGQSRYLYFYNTAAAQSYGGRAFGFSVRCIEDENP